VDVVRPLRDAREGAGRDRADGHAARHHGSGVVGDATRARRELGDRMVDALIPRIVQVCKETAGKE
jgi:creatinine amidohydrolase/Fe(II)-dependent formamide hydrolase-like protein